MGTEEDARDDESRKSWFKVLVSFAAVRLAVTKASGCVGSVGYVTEESRWRGDDRVDRARYMHVCWDLPKDEHLAHIQCSTRDHVQPVTTLSAAPRRASRASQALVARQSGV